MMEKLFQSGQGCHFIIYNTKCSRKTILQVQLEDYFKQNKNKDNLIFNFVNSDDESGKSHIQIQNLISQYPNRNTFIDELTLSSKKEERGAIFQQIAQQWRNHSKKLCLWIAVAGIDSGKKEDFIIPEIQSIFPDFFIPKLRFPLRNCRDRKSVV